MLQGLTNQYVIVARDVSTDANDNTLSILKMVDKVEIGLDHITYDRLTKDASFKFSPQLTFAVAASFGVKDYAEKDSDFTVRFVIVSPLGKKLVKVDQQVKLQKGTDKVRINLNLQGMPLDSSGKYIFTASAVDGEKVLAEGSTTLDVRLFEQQPESV